MKSAPGEIRDLDAVRARSLFRDARREEIWLPAYWPAGRDFGLAAILRHQVENRDHPLPPCLHGERGDRVAMQAKTREGPRPLVGSGKRHRARNRPGQSVSSRESGAPEPCRLATRSRRKRTIQARRRDGPRATWSTPIAHPTVILGLVPRTHRATVSARRNGPLVAVVGSRDNTLEVRRVLDILADRQSAEAGAGRS
jgi:hypothetical protein